MVSAGHQIILDVGYHRKLFSFQLPPECPSSFTSMYPCYNENLYFYEVAIGYYVAANKGLLTNAVDNVNINIFITSKVLL